jgi:hypothetical protein
MKRELQEVFCLAAVRGCVAEFLTSTVGMDDERFTIKVQYPTSHFVGDGERKSGFPASVFVSNDWNVRL